jgi:predicted nucleotidyltransferase
MSQMEEGEPIDEDDLPDWQKDTIAVAGAILNDDGTRFIDPPTRNASREFDCMREFAEQWHDKAVSKNLLRQLGGRGSFARFREAIFEHRIQDEWRTFQDTNEKEALIEWCREHNVAFDDDMHIGPPEHATSDREHLLSAASWFVEKASKLEEVEQIALIGSLCKDQRKPKDLDLLVTIAAGSEVKRVAKLRRGLQGRISRGSMGADVFIVEDGANIGRACQYRDPWPRVACSEAKLRCLQDRQWLCDTSADFTLDQKLIDQPPVILWPKAKACTGIPEDVLKLLKRLTASPESDQG